MSAEAVDDRRRMGTVEGERGEPGQRSHRVGVRHVIAPRPGSAEARRADDDEPRVPRLQHLWTDAHTVEGAGAEVLDHNIGVLGEPKERLDALGLAEVQRDASLVAVHVVEVAARVGIELASREVHELRETGRIGSVTRLDLDYVRTVVGEHPRRVRSGEHPREVEHDDAVERATPRSWPVRGRRTGPPWAPTVPRERVSRSAGRSAPHLGDGSAAPRRGRSSRRRRWARARPGPGAAGSSPLPPCRAPLPTAAGGVGPRGRTHPWQCPGERLDDGEDVLTVLSQPGRVTHHLAAQVSRLACLVHPVQQAGPHARVAAQPSRHPPRPRRLRRAMRRWVAAAVRRATPVGVDVLLERRRLRGCRRRIKQKRPRPTRHGRSRARSASASSAPDGPVDPARCSRWSTATPADGASGQPPAQDSHARRHAAPARSEARSTTGRPWPRTA